MATTKIKSASAESKYPSDQPITLRGERVSVRYCARLARRTGWRVRHRSAAANAKSRIPCRQDSSRPFLSAKTMWLDTFHTRRGKRNASGARRKVSARSLHTPEQCCRGRSRANGTLVVPDVHALELDDLIARVDQPEAKVFFLATVGSRKLARSRRASLTVDRRNT